MQFVRSWSAPSAEAIDRETDNQGGAEDQKSNKSHIPKEIFRSQTTAVAEATTTTTTTPEPVDDEESMRHVIENPLFYTQLKARKAANRQVIRTQHQDKIQRQADNNAGYYSANEEQVPQVVPEIYAEIAKYPAPFYDRQQQPRYDPKESQAPRYQPGLVVPAEYPAKHEGTYSPPTYREPSIGFSANTKYQETGSKQNGAYVSATRYEEYNPPTYREPVRQESTWIGYDASKYEKTDFKQGNEQQTYSPISELSYPTVSKYQEVNPMPTYREPTIGHSSDIKYQEAEKQEVYTTTSSPHSAITRYEENFSTPIYREPLRQEPRNGFGSDVKHQETDIKQVDKQEAYPPIGVPYPIPSKYEELNPIPTYREPTIGYSPDIKYQEAEKPQLFTTTSSPHPTITRYEETFPVPIYREPLNQEPSNGYGSDVKHQETDIKQVDKQEAYPPISVPYPTPSKYEELNPIPTYREPTIGYSSDTEYQEAEKPQLYTTTSPPSTKTKYEETFPTPTYIEPLRKEPANVYSTDTKYQETDTKQIEQQTQSSLKSVPDAYPNNEGKDYKNIPTPAPRKRYPVIIGRYQVTDSDAFLPIKVDSEEKVARGNYGDREEYLVYYLPYGQPLPVSLPN